MEVNVIAQLLALAEIRSIQSKAFLVSIAGAIALDPFSSVLLTGLMGVVSWFIYSFITETKQTIIKNQEAAVRMEMLLTRLDEQIHGITNNCELRHRNIDEDIENIKKSLKQ